MSRLLVGLLVLLALLPLQSCAKKGDLEPPESYREKHKEDSAEGQEKD